MVFLMIFLFGLAIGSFLNAFIYRLEVQQGLRSISGNQEKAKITVLQGRSFCPSCEHTLAWYDLIPLLSFILLKGKCRYCKEKISFQYPFVELATALLFISIFYLIVPWLGQGLPLQAGVDNLAKPSFLQVLGLFYLWIIASLLMVIFVYDLKHFIISDKVLFPAIGLVVLWRIFELGLLNHWKLIENFALLVNPLLAGILAATFFLLIFLLSRGRAMGFGDVKLALFMGLFLGFPNILVALMVSFILGAMVGLVLIFLKRKTMRSEVPFGPFLVLGTFVALFWGEPLVNFYLGLIGV